MSLWPSHINCPIDSEAQAWVDGRMGWLAQQFGLDTWKRAVLIEPTDKFFPDRFDGTEQAVQRMLAHVCAYMHVDPSIVALCVCDNDPESDPKEGEEPPAFEPGKGHHYRAEGKNVIAILNSDLDDPMDLVATIAHELAHLRLIEARRSTGHDQDHEPLADLATVFFGLGIFTANSTCRFKQWHRGRPRDWKMDCPGFLTEQGFGYALGLWTIIRNQENPPWERHLRPDVRTYLRQAIRYLIANPPDQSKMPPPQSQ